MPRGAAPRPCRVYIRSRIGLLVIQFETAKEMPAKRKSVSAAAKRKAVEEEQALEKEQVPDEESGDQFGSACVVRA